MPVSVFDPIPLIFRVIQFYRPRTILDVGIGFGKYGILCRESLDLYHGRIGPSDWATQIDGIEVFENYRNPLWQIYDQVYIGNASDVLPGLPHYDIIICSDVIEHLDKSEGHALIRACVEKSDLLIINTPRIFFEQGETAGNLHESHKALWKSSDFRIYNSISTCPSSAVLSVYIFKKARFVNRMNIFMLRQDNAIGQTLRWLRTIYYRMLNPDKRTD